MSFSTPSVPTSAPAASRSIAIEALTSMRWPSLPRNPVS
jgi:hypothetical protein